MTEQLGLLDDAVADDPNADLVGYGFPVEDGGLLRVTESASWNPAYVLCVVTRQDGTERLTCRAAGLLRARRLRGG